MNKPAAALLLLAVVLVVLLAYDVGKAVGRQELGIPSSRYACHAGEQFRVLWTCE